jgi:LacI family transcriptional regulator
MMDRTVKEMTKPASRQERESGLPAGRRPRVLVLLAWYATGVFRGIARVAQDAHWIIDSSFERSGKIPADWEGDGVIAVLGVDDAVDSFVAECRVPVVNIGYSHPAAAPQVIADQEAIARMAADHFLVRGFRNVAYYLRSGRPGDIGRWEAFRSSLEARGVTPVLIDPATAGLSSRRKGIRRWLGKELRSLPKPLAVFAEFDDHAIEILDAAVGEGLSVPHELAVLGVGNDELRCPFAPVPLSSVDDNPMGIGEAAAALLGSLMRGQQPPVSPVIVSPLGVNTRRSTDILAVEHPLVALALQEIRKHYREPLTAEGIVATIPMSRRRLHDAFMRLIGHSVADEVTRLRIKHAKRLLAETEDKHHTIAGECGFRSEARLSVVFQRETGMTPGDYRRSYNPLFSHRSKIGRPGGS